ncbi:MAG: hypothetical protein WBV62_11985, partial [Roseobacter sp.]
RQTVRLWLSAMPQARTVGFGGSELGSLPSFAAQSTNGRNAENRPFAALVANVSVAVWFQRVAATHASNFSAGV